MTGIVVGAAIVRAGRLLAQRRAEPPELAGRWELPGGQVEPGESEVAALRRECWEELGARITVTHRVGADQPLGTTKLLRIYAATLLARSPEPRAVEHAAVRWLHPATLADLDWLDADRALLPDLAALLARAHHHPIDSPPNSPAP
ncbi:(deoxy)nucleoside triphosphate pyrophosphohydrolase [Pseudonocardia acaciae]|uniref:(deoxy)nucleoside triphosphate pyrophosphohydrolase n=1 Tax=Pseudonocardia acaciae TaxID=551276 RepID=UPI000686667F|nr:NUDIX domain-containing protein [Pseudonocardia acaciae]